MTERSEHGYSPRISEGETEGMGGCLLRLYWLVIAPIALLGLAASLAKTGAGPLSKVSVIYWVVAVGALLVRYLDIFRFQGETAAGSPASRADWRGFAIRLTLVAVGVWAVALGIGAA